MQPQHFNKHPAYAGGYPYNRGYYGGHPGYGGYPGYGHPGYGGYGYGHPAYYGPKGYRKSSKSPTRQNKTLLNDDQLVDPR